MRYVKLFAPLLIISLIDLWLLYFVEPMDMTLAIILKVSVLIYYLRLDNAGTPLINTLSVILVIMGIGEYLLPIYVLVGQILYATSALAFWGSLFYQTYTERDQRPTQKDKNNISGFFLAFRNSDSNQTIGGNPIYSCQLIGGIRLFLR
ncbi:MAG: hypothetical protein QM734_07055 [Cyclobacteriaceae bacterium]